MNNTQLKLEEINIGKKSVKCNTIHINKTVCSVGIVNKCNATFNDLLTRSQEELAQTTRIVFLEHAVIHLLRIQHLCDKNSYILRDEHKSCRKLCSALNFSTVRTRYSGLKPIVISYIRKGNVWGREEVLTGF